MTELTPEQIRARAPQAHVFVAELLGKRSAPLRDRMYTSYASRIAADDGLPVDDSAFIPIVDGIFTMVFARRGDISTPEDAVEAAQWDAQRKRVYDQLIQTRICYDLAMAEEIVDTVLRHAEYACLDMRGDAPLLKKVRRSRRPEQYTGEGEALDPLRAANTRWARQVQRHGGLLDTLDTMQDQLPLYHNFCKACEENGILPSQALNVVFYDLCSQVAPVLSFVPSFRTRMREAEVAKVRRVLSLAGLIPMALQNVLVECEVHTAKEAGLDVLEKLEKGAIYGVPIRERLMVAETLRSHFEPVNNLLNMLRQPRTFHGELQAAMQDAILNYIAEQRNSGKRGLA